MFFYRVLKRHLGFPRFSFGSLWVSFGSLCFCGPCNFTRVASLPLLKWSPLCLQAKGDLRNPQVYSLFYPQASLTIQNN